MLCAEAYVKRQSLFLKLLVSYPLHLPDLHLKVEIVVKIFKYTEYAANSYTQNTSNRERNLHTVNYVLKAQLNNQEM